MAFVMLYASVVTSVDGVREQSASGYAAVLHVTTIRVTGLSVRVQMSEFCLTVFAVR
jgi:hypothetical protein